MTLADLARRIMTTGAVLRIQFLRGTYVVNASTPDDEYDLTRVNPSLEVALSAALDAYDAWWAPRRVEVRVADGGTERVEQ